MKWIQNAVLGSLISLSISYIVITISTLLNDTHFWSGKELLEELLLAIVLGIIIGFATLLFEIEQWSYKLILVIHFLLVLTSVFIVGAFGEWYSITNPKSVFLLFSEVVLIYIIVWVIMLFLEKKEIEGINKIIRKR